MHVRFNYKTDLALIGHHHSSSNDFPLSPQSAYSLFGGLVWKGVIFALSPIIS